MAIWTFDRRFPGMDLMSSPILDVVETLEVERATSTIFRFQDPFFGDLVTFTGTGLTYATSNTMTQLTGGTFNGFSIRLDGETVVKAWTGFSISAPTVFQYLADNNRAALNTLIFNTSDTYNMTDDADSVRGFGGNDRINGFGGNDRLFGDSGNDTLGGGLGNDALRGDAGNDSLLGDSGNDTLTAGLGNDILRGDAGNDSLLGDSGNDKLFGDSGADRLNGGLGADTLIGGVGIDTMIGGAGADVFAFNDNGATNREIISDFIAVDDALHFNNDAFTAFAYTGQLRASGFVLGTAATDLADRFIYQLSTGNLWYDRDGSGAAAKVLVAELADGTGLTTADIFIL